MEINFANPHRYEIKSDEVIKRLSEFFASKSIELGSVSLALLDEEEMLRVAKEFLDEGPPSVHNVLSFTEKEKKGEFLGDEGYIGEILVCYSKAKQETGENDKEVNEWITELFVHGAEHLLGNHHG